MRRKKQHTQQTFSLDENVEKLIRENFLIFLLEKWKISSGEFEGREFSFKDRPFLMGLVNDDFPFIVKLKSAQSGQSEIEVARAIWKMITQKGNVIYTFPAAEQMRQFVDARARPAIIKNEYLLSKVDGNLNLNKFAINNNSLYFRGAQKRRQMISVDANSLFADEVDTYEDEKAIDTLNKRLGASTNPYRCYFSTPSYHASGISLYYYGNEASGERGSDQRVWTIRCECCGQFNEDLLWNDNILDLNDKDRKFSHYTPDIIIICRHCKKPLNRLSNGEWVPTITKNSSYCHGYHISKLFHPAADLNVMYLDSKNPLKEQEFYNSDLGLPYEPRGARLTDANLDAARGNHLLAQFSTEPVFAGVDRGNKIHAIAGKRDENGNFKIINISELDSEEELHDWYKNLNVKVSVLDMNPDKDSALVFQNQHEGTWLAYFSIHLEKTTQQFNKNWDDKQLGVNRTLMMMYVSDLLCEKSIILPIDVRRAREFYEHMKSPIKAQKDDVHGKPVTFYPKTKNPDHYYFAMLYFLLACQIKMAPGTVRYKSLYL